MSHNVEEQIGLIVKESLGLDAVPCASEKDAPLKQYGMDSVAMIRMAVAVEKCFRLKFKGRDLLEKNFATIAAIEKLVWIKLEDAAAVKSAAGGGFE
ncbi:acyl carrier protein [Paenibacillus sp. 1001270B_150601_E10]|uniref:acyl carrier protein n=1 Tax=Paenibacillus sp. 1001270B_150601_E10 TaxID=2787079 RepID=UPI00189E3C47|nr:acyl carrier protein [Paenibacillus sp. 1001270B_150601_E10]